MAFTSIFGKSFGLGRNIPRPFTRMGVTTLRSSVMKTLRLLALLLLAAQLVTTGCRKEDAPASGTTQVSQVPADWYRLSFRLTQQGTGYSPPVAARAFGYMGVAFYEAMAPGIPGARSLQGQLMSFSPGTVPGIITGKTYDWEVVANAVLAQSCRRLYPNASPENAQKINDLDNYWHNTLTAGIPSDVGERSREYGISVAEAVFAFAKTDGQYECYLNNFPDSYTPPVGPGLWVPTPPAFSRCLQPYWGSVRPFVAANVTSVQPDGPPPFSKLPGSQFYYEGLEVYTVSLNLSSEQRKIAEYWSDDPGLTATPPGHSLSVALQVLEQENASLAEMADVLARVGMAVHDAFVSCWRSKYIHNLLRPVTYIRDLFDPAWNSLLTTPPFPEYTSGHSVQAGAAATVLSALYGTSYSFIDRTHEGRTDIDGTARSFGSFREMADQAAISRLYGGIHFKSAIDEGVEQGQRIGENISALRTR